MARQGSTFACPCCQRGQSRVDLGYRPFRIPKAEPSPWRIPEPGGEQPVILSCQYEPCGLPLSSAEGPRARYHVACRKLANQAQTCADRRQERAQLKAAS